MERIEATTWELWQWRIAKTVRIIFFYFIAWPVFIASIPATIYMGFTLMGDLLTGIRDWWHYRETVRSDNGWMAFAIMVTGLIWIVGMAWGETPAKDETTRFNEFIESGRSTKEYLQKEREKPKTRWGWFWHYVTMAYGVLMLGMLAALVVKEVFF